MKVLVVEGRGGMHLASKCLVLLFYFNETASGENKLWPVLVKGNFRISSCRIRAASVFYSSRKTYVSKQAIKLTCVGESGSRAP